MYSAISNSSTVFDSTDSIFKYYIIVKGIVGGAYQPIHHAFG